MSQVIVTTPEELQRIIVDAVASVLPRSTPSAKKRLLSGKDVEREFGITNRSLEQWRATGSGPAYTTVGRKIFYEREMLEAYIASGRVHTGARYSS